MAQNKINKKVYVGQTVRSLSARRSGHYRDAFVKKTNNYFHRSLRKYGKDAFEWSIIKECRNRFELDASELFYIGYYRGLLVLSGGKQYNLDTGMNPHNVKYGEDNYFYGKVGAAHPCSKKYILTSPEGDIYYVHGLREFCRQNPQFNLIHSKLSYCAKGKQKATKGWRCEYVSV